MKRKSSRFEHNKTSIRNRDTGSSPAKKGRRRRRRTSGAKIALVVTVLLALVIGVVLSLTVFFKVKSIDVYGETRYSSKEIIKAGKIELESNLIRLNSSLISKRIETALPYIEDVKVKKSLPTTVDLVVEAAQIAGYVEHNSHFYLLSTKGKVLEILSDKPENTATLLGVSVNDKKVCQYVENEQGSMDYVNKIYTALGQVMSKNITEVNVTDRVGLTFVYNDRITVRLGSENDLSEKLKFVIKILSDPEKISQDDMGIIYATNAKKISFLRKGSYEEYLSQLEAEEKQQNEDTSSSLSQTESENPALNDQNVSSLPTTLEN